MLAPEVIPISCLKLEIGVWDEVSPDLSAVGITSDVVSCSVVLC